MTIVFRTNYSRFKRNEEFTPSSELEQKAARHYMSLGVAYKKPCKCGEEKGKCKECEKAKEPPTKTRKVTARKTKK